MESGSTVNSRYEWALMQQMLRHNELFSHSQPSFYTLTLWDASFNRILDVMNSHITYSEHTFLLL